MPISKVIYGADTIIDITDTTATASDVAEGKILYTADGLRTIGTGAIGGGAVEEKDVNFYDYDGTRLYSYSASDFASLSAMPSNPTHTGLTAQGWNWTLSDAKTYVSSYGELNIGQMYITDDGKTRIYIALQEGRLSPYLGLAVNGSVDVDWGDGSQHDTLTGTSTATLVFIQHVYANAGSYVITLDPDNSSEFVIKGNLLGATGQSQDNSNDYVYTIAVKSIKFGQRIKSIGANAFYHCYGLVSITIPNSVTSIVGSAFSGCYGLASITIPSSVTSIGNAAFSSCYNLASVTIPNSVTSIGSSMFTSCYNLASITIPSSIRSIGVSAFSNCYNLASITIPSSVTSIGNAAFSNCYNLASVTIPNSVTSIGISMFTSCYNLASVTIPSGVASIGSTMFQYCYGLVSITIPNSVTSIGVSAFSNCCGLAAIYFKRSTPPTVVNANAFNKLPTDCNIYVPTGKLSEYKSASNYPDSNTYTYVEE